MESDCNGLSGILEELDRTSPDVPLLALGQTVFWDEPMKLGVLQRVRALGSQRKFVAGVHDTDYFAKFSAKGNEQGFVALPHNDTSTQNLWSAAGEMSCLFGSETVVTKDALAAAGGKVSKVEQLRPGFLDEVTEAWGWRGVVSRSKESRITAEKSLARTFPVFYDTFQWAIDESLRLVSGEHHVDSLKAADRLLTMACDGVDRVEDGRLSTYFQELIKPISGQLIGEEIDFDTTASTQLFRFNTKTCDQPRFQIVDRFLNPETRKLCEEAYDASVKDSDIYTLDRFGAGALPFDLYIPGIGRGTIRLGTRGGLISAHSVVGFSYKKRPQNVKELAEVLEAKFGEEIVLIGKAISLILMLATEFVFVFHKGASSYVWRSGEMAKRLNAQSALIKLHPILRVEYRPWDAMSQCCAWLKLPEPLQRPFGTMELSAPSFAVRWREVAATQEKLLEELRALKRPLALLKFLQSHMGGQWNCLASEYESMQDTLQVMAEQLKECKAKKRETVLKLRSAKARRNAIQHAKGEQWRSEIFEKDADDLAIGRRERFEADLRATDEEIVALKKRYLVQAQEQEEMVSAPEIQRIRERRSDMALEAEMMRLRLIREAIVSTEGLRRAGYRPSAWWFSLVCPDGTWFKKTMDLTQYRLEYLV